MKYKYGKWKCVDNILRLEYTTLEKLTEQYCSIVITVAY